MAFLSPVTAGRPVGEARFVLAILLPVRTPSLRRVFRDSDHAECYVSAVHSCDVTDNSALQAHSSAVESALI